VYRFSEGFNYPNATHYLDFLVQTIFKETRRTTLDSWPRPGDRPWNDPGPRRGKKELDRSHLPILRAVVLDFSSVNNVDVTSVQNLIDVRNQLSRYANPEPVQWHFAHINNRWTKRALSSAGFGFPTADSDCKFAPWKPIFSVAHLGSDQAVTDAEEQVHNVPGTGHSAELGRATEKSGQGVDGVEATSGASSKNGSGELQKELTTSKAYDVSRRRVTLIQGLNRPLFHIDLPSALQSAVANAQAQERMGPRKNGSEESV